MPPKPRKLTGKQLAFCEAYLANGFNAYRAAKAAEYAGNDQTLRGIGSRNLTNVNISTYIDERIVKKMGADEVLERLTQMARGDISWFIIEADGKTLELDEEAIMEYGHLIKELRPTKHGIAIKLHDPQAALVTLAKHHKLLTEKREIIGRLEIHKYLDDLPEDERQKIVEKAERILAGDAGSGSDIGDH